MNTRALLTLLALTPLALQGCMNASSLQTARTLDPGQQRATAGIGYSASDDNSLIAPYYVEVSYRYGVIENLDVGAKFTLIGSTSIDGKYRLLDSGPLQLAAGLSVGGMQLNATTGSAEDGTEEEFTRNVVDVMVPVYASYDIVDWFSVYASPKYVMRSSFGDGGDTTFTHFYGSSLGVKLGTTMGMFLEGTGLASSDGDPALQGNASFFWQPDFL